MNVELIMTIAIVMLLCADVFDLVLLEKHCPHEFMRLDCPKWFWADQVKVVYLFGYILPFRFLSLENPWIVMLMVIEAVCLWVVLLALLKMVFI